jgi:colanic acid/amylovoran biosynthesis glycosyltransferase
MPTVAYIANQFPSPVEPYVMEEIRELRERGVRVVACSVRRPKDDDHLDGRLKAFAAETLYLLPLRLDSAEKAASLCWRHRSQLDGLIERVLRQGDESMGRRCRTLLHTWLGACYALLLAGQDVEHIHAHHGYFASWIAMIAARLLGISFSMTLHGSDLLLHPAYLDTKLEHCRFSLTISEFNRQYILQHYPGIAPEKILVSRMGVAPPEEVCPGPGRARDPSRLVILAVGRLHAVKDHAFLIRACRRLKRQGISLACLIAGEGPERPRLERLIRDFGLQTEVKLLGHVARTRLDGYYAACDLVVLTSHSEGIPLVLMEAMAHGRPVLAPAITGIPELVVDGTTGFLYRAGSLNDFVSHVQAIGNLRPALGPLRQAARQHVLEHFHRDKNLADFGDLFLASIPTAQVNHFHEDSLLQQIQL